MAEQTISADKLCSLTSLTDRRHRQLAKEGYFPPPERGQYKLTATIQGMFRYYAEQLHKKDDNLATERKKYTVVRREKLEIERDILRRLYLPRSEIGPILRNLAANQRAALQNKLENELSVKLSGLDPITIRARMAEAVDQICDMFQQSTRKWLDDAPKA
jgi:hypothetical protein